MKRGFTLIELLVTVTIVATLMTITFKISASSKEDEAKAKTILNLQKLENCLSGYNAAFGSYPPVKVYGTRNIYVTVENGVQTDDSSGTELRWDQIDAACSSQPVDCAFPFHKRYWENVNVFSEELQEMLSRHSDWEEDNPHVVQVIREGFGPGNAADFTSCWDKDDWREVQIFKFGLLSYLLPRYLVMMQGDKLFYGAEGNKACAQWSVNNDKCISVEDGVSEYTWKEVYDYVDPEVNNRRDYARVSNLPAQAVCARWISNLEEICLTAHDYSLFGVKVSNSGDSLFNADKYDEDGSKPPQLNVYSPGGKGGNWYLLDTITCYDGWYRSFYYYSPTGAQSYTLWSSGKNGRTFPPWIDPTGLLDQYIMEKNGRGGGYHDGIKVSEAIADDIVRMRN